MLPNLGAQLQLKLLQQKLRLVLLKKSKEAQRKMLLKPKKKIQKIP